MLVNETAGRVRMRSGNADNDAVNSSPLGRVQRAARDSSKKMPELKYEGG